MNTADSVKVVTIYNNELKVTLDYLPKDISEHSRPDAVRKRVKAVHLGRTLHLVVIRSCVV